MSIFPPIDEMMVSISEQTGMSVADIKKAVSVYKATNYPSANDSLVTFLWANNEKKILITIKAPESSGPSGFVSVADIFTGKLGNKNYSLRGYVFRSREGVTSKGGKQFTFNFVDETGGIVGKVWGENMTSLWESLCVKDGDSVLLEGMQTFSPTGNNPNFTGEPPTWVSLSGNYASAEVINADQRKELKLPEIEDLVTPVVELKIDKWVGVRGFLCGKQVRKYTGCPVCFKRFKETTATGKAVCESERCKKTVTPTELSIVTLAISEAMGDSIFATAMPWIPFDISIKSGTQIFLYGYLNDRRELQVSFYKILSGGTPPVPKELDILTSAPSTAQLKPGTNIKELEQMMSMMRTIFVFWPTIHRNEFASQMKIKYPNTTITSEEVLGAFLKNGEIKIDGEFVTKI